MGSFPHLFSPIQLGNFELANRVVHVPTDISSSHADGEVSERDIAHHAEVARGGAGFIIVGATTPNAQTGRPTVTCLVAVLKQTSPSMTAATFLSLAPRSKPMRQPSR
ncbi:MAG: hypothetical protein ABSG37_08750 [Candidatus Limnocylindrales bacterium]